MIGYLIFLGIPALVFVALTAAEKYTPLKRLLIAFLTFLVLIIVFVIIIIIGGDKPI